jgi:hypothetical protein
MLVKCERCQTEWDVTPHPYPSKGCQTTHSNSKGDQCIDCPTCGRGYFLEEDGQWICDRPLTVLKA